MITPQQAQELLRGDFASEVRERMVGNLEAGFNSFDGAHIEGTPGDFALAEAAPELAELVANMHYEYAAQVLEDGWWRTLGLRGTYKQAVALANLWRGDTYRVARRLTTDWEVFE